jgi:hypothetical protein
VHALQTSGAFDEANIGNQRNRGADDNVAVLTSAVEGAWASNKALVAIYIDLSKAFDRCSHAHLVRAFLDMRSDVAPELRGAYLHSVRWLREFLTGREQVARVSKCLSKKLPLRQGLPQGSVLGPLAWKAFVQGLIKILRSHDCAHGLLSFYDDLALYEAASDPALAAARLQPVLDDIAAWAREHNMDLSVEKTQYQVFVDPKAVPRAAKMPECEFTVQGDDRWAKDRRVREKTGRRRWGTIASVGENAVGVDFDRAGAAAAPPEMVGKDELALLLKGVESARFLGVQFDWRLRFDKQLAKTLRTFRRRLGAVRVLARASWARGRLTCAFFT